MTILDMHVLLHPSQHRPLHAVDHPDVVVHQLLGYLGHIGFGRYHGFMCGSAPFVSFYDDDDIVHVDELSSLLTILHDDPTIDVLCSAEKVSSIRGVRESIVDLSDMQVMSYQDLLHAHHLVIIRRSALQSFVHRLIDWPDLCEFSLYAVMHKSGCKFVWTNRCCYTWVDHAAGARSLKIAPTLDSVNYVQEMIGCEPITLDKFNENLRSFNLVVYPSP